MYVSPLKALSYDVEKNLRAPLKGIGGDVAVAIRTGDTPQKERQAMLRTPPDVLITTPESLYLMLTSKAREFLADAEAVIVDEIHAVARTKRGAHLALTLERLEALADPRAGGAREPSISRPLQRIGLSATQRPLDEVGRFLVGTGRKCTVIDTGIRKPLDLKIHVPVESMREPDAHDVTDPAYGGQGTAAGGGDLVGDGLGGTAPAATSRSIWPAIYPELLRLIREHRSTIVFVNSRRGAERLAVRLNDLAAEESDNGAEAAYIARAHHGSLAREERLVVEDLLKSGELPCLVATSSLELGIDMGAVDLVIQVESPKSVTAGLQRIGRAGHGVGEISRGRIFPKFRADLLECAVVARRMRDGDIEPTVVPRNPLDVLAQQIVAMSASGDEELKVPVLHETIRRAYPFAELSRELLDSVLDMLDGRYPSEEFAELRPRIVWDRVEDTIRPRRGALQLAVTNAGTIPDRGLYGVHLPDGRRVGELDEEMVYEARPGQTFLLGASTWRIEEITRDRVIVTPAPGAPGAVPFWKGDGIGRPKELGLAIGAFARESVDREPADLAAEYDLDERAANNLSAFLREQREATRVVPSDRTIVVERFRDEIGDWRLCVLSPFGGRVHSAWALALSARIRDEYGLESDAIWSDDGIIVHLPDADEPPSSELLMIEPDAIEDMVVAELSGLGAVRGSLSRERGARAAPPPCLPRQAHSAVAAAAQGAVAARGREALRAVPDRARDLPRVPSGRARPAGAPAAAHRPAHARAVARRGRDPARVAVRLVAALRLRGHLHVRGRHAERGAACGGAVARPRPAAGAARPGGAPRADRPRRARGGRGRPPADQRAHARRELRRAPRRAARAGRPHGGRGAGPLPAGRGRPADPHRAREGAARHQDADRRRGALDRRRGRGAVSRRARGRAARRAAGHLPRGGRGPARAARAPLRADPRPVHDPRCERALPHRLGPGPPGARARRRSRPGELRPGGSEREWCDPDVLRRLRRASLATLRKEVEPAEQRALARFLPEWQGVDRSPPGGAGVDRLREMLVPLQGLALAPEVWERDVLPRRVGAYSPAWMDQLCASGELVWVGAGSLGRNSGRVALLFREDARFVGPPPYKGQSPSGAAHDTIRERLERGAAFWTDLLADLTTVEPAELQEALWDLAWAGEVTNDAFAPLRAPKLSVAKTDRQAGRRFARRRRPRAPQVQGRWSLTGPLFAGAPSHGPRMRAISELLLERHGIVTREAVLAEGIPGGFAGLYSELANLETLGTARRGYFVEGLGGAQFALPAAIERLRGLRSDEPAGTLVLAATDPANPYGATLPWPRRDDDDSNRRPARVPGAYVVSVDAEPLLYVERGGKGLLALREPEDDWLPGALEALAAEVRRGRIPRLGIERFDGEPVVGSPAGALLIELGFRQSPRRLTLSA